MIEATRRNDAGRSSASLTPAVNGEHYGAVVDLAIILATTVEDLRNRSRLTASEYDVVQASGLLRRLLIDASAVVPRAVKSLSLDEPRYEWASVYAGEVSGAFLDPVLLKSVGQALMVRDARLLGAVHNGSLSDFLAVKVAASTADGDVTVKDLIKHYAIVEGGVHHGQAWNSIPQRLQLLLADPVYEPRLRETLAAIGRIVSTALSGPAMIALHPGMREIFERAAQLAPTPGKRTGV